MKNILIPRRDFARACDTESARAPRARAFLERLKDAFPAQVQAMPLEDLRDIAVRVSDHKDLARANRQLEKAFGVIESIPAVQAQRDAGVRTRRSQQRNFRLAG